MRKPVVVAASFFVLAVAGAPAWAGWGCGDSTGQARTWAADTEDEARAAASRTCRKVAPNPGVQCRVITCRPDVDTLEQARALWPPAGPAVCGPTTGKAC